MTTPDRTPHARRADPLESALAALAVALLCSLLVDSFGGVDSLRLARKATWDWLAARLQGDASRVVVVDISSIGRPSNALGQPVTDRDQLRAVIDALAQAGPRAIGIDIDFSPENGAPVDARDPELLKRLASLRRDDGTRIPVRLGVNRTRSEDRAAWLGTESWASMASTLVADTADNRVMPARIAWRPGLTLWGLGAATALAKADSGDPDLPPSRWPAGLATPFDDHAPTGLVVTSFFVDFSTLPDLLDHRLPAAARSAELVPDDLVASLKDELAADPSLVRDKVVFIGFGDPARMADNGFVAPGMLRAAPGLYAHAAAAATLLGDGYLYAPTPLLEKMIDTGLTLVLIGLVALIRWKVLRRLTEADELALHVLLTAGAVLVLWFGIGPGLLRLFRIVPDGLPIVTLGLFVEVLWDPLVVLFRAVRSGLPRGPAAREV